MSPINLNVIQVGQFCIYHSCAYASSEIGTYLAGVSKPCLAHAATDDTNEHRFQKYAA